jgi:hypothetical protein
LNRQTAQPFWILDFGKVVAKGRGTAPTFFVFFAFLVVNFFSRMALEFFSTTYDLL